MATGTDLIAAERRRQIAVEGWTPDHDVHHATGELAAAALCYVRAGIVAINAPSVAVTVRSFIERRYPDHDFAADLDFQQMTENAPRHHFGWDKTPNGWPWAAEYWKPTGDPIRNLVKAGALIAAEIDRLQAALH